MNGGGEAAIDPGPGMERAIQWAWEHGSTYYKKANCFKLLPITRWSPSGLGGGTEKTHSIAAVWLTPASRG